MLYTKSIPHLHEQPVHVDGARLPDAVRPVHGLQVLHGVPVMLQEHHGVRAGQVQPQPAHVRRQQQHLRVHALTPAAGRDDSAQTSKR